ncbi:MAG: radical SAM protein, partial [Terrimicrobiaceae bacterium]
MSDIEPRFRPPAEADSLLLGIAMGCPWNRCTFCAMYRDRAYRVKTMEEIRRTIAKAARQAPESVRIFLADGNVMALPFTFLKEILTELNQAFPRLARVN